MQSRVEVSGLHESDLTLSSAFVSQWQTKGGKRNPQKATTVIQLQATAWWWLHIIMRVWIFFFLCGVSFFSLCTCAQVVMVADRSAVEFLVLKTLDQLVFHQVIGERGGDRSGGRATNISLIRAAERQILLSCLNKNFCTFPGLYFYSVALLEYICIISNILFIFFWLFILPLSSCSVSNRPFKAPLLMKLLCPVLSLLFTVI